MGTFLSSLRISTKLAINAGFAILLVLALAGTTILELRQIAMEGETAARSMRTLESTMEARAARLAMPTLNRDIRMAQDAATVDRALASFDEALAIVQRELAAALASATLPENRARLETAGRETAAIVDANRRVAALRKEHLEIRNAIVFGGGGPLAQAIAAIQAAAPLAGHPEEARIRTLLQQTADALLDARIGGQRYMGSNEPAQRERTLNAGRAAIRDVNAARDLVPPGHPARPGLEDLAHRVQAYITGFERAVNNLDQINRLQEETIAPLQARIDGTMAEVFSAARDRTQQAQANLHEAQARASAIALWLSLAVLLLLA
ncbi:MAG TPA: hypothetical protein VD970_04265, partial [Acetobacteraceae bacterium]|nr:hypothetical protein [Acetobacteraceae bacterium]